MPSKLRRTSFALKAKALWLFCCSIASLLVLLEALGARVSCSPRRRLGRSD